MCRCCPSTTVSSASPHGAAWPSCCWTRSGGTRPNMDWRAPRAPVWSETLDQLLGGLLRRPVEIEGPDESAVLTHQIDQRRVFHGVIAVLERHLSGVGPESLHGCIDRRAVPGQADDAIVETAEIALQNLGRVAFGIDGHEQRPQVAPFVARRPQHLRNLEQLGRANIRAMREAEEDEVRLAEEGALRHG